VTPTRCPTWRSLAFAIAIIELLGLAASLHRYGIRPLLHASETRPMERVSLFCQAISMAGALTLRGRPALGLFIFGAGFLALDASLVVLLPWERPPAIPVAGLRLPGLGYTRLGVNQLAADRG
jgi:hypothetical protein